MYSRYRSHLRPIFARRRALLGKLRNIVQSLFACLCASARRGAQPGKILFVQTLGDLVNCYPHIHVLAADGAFDADGGFRVPPPIPRKVLEPWFRKEVLALLRRVGLISELLAERILAWRTPFSLRKLSYAPVSGIVIYRSRIHKTYKGNS